MKKKPRKVQPENWAALLGYGEALREFAKSGNPDEFRGCLISHKKMSECLIAIAYGMDAQKVFLQGGKPGRQELGWFHTTVAFEYWGARCVLKLGHKQAVEKLQSRTAHFQRPLTGASIARIARDFREYSLQDLESTGVDTSVVRAELKVKSKRGKMA